MSCSLLRERCWNGLGTALVRPWYGVGISLVGWGFFCGAISPPTVACWGVQTDAFWREMLSSVCKLCFVFCLFVYLFLGSKDKHFLAIFTTKNSVYSTLVWPYSTQVSRLLHTWTAHAPHKCGLTADCKVIMDVLLNVYMNSSVCEELNAYDVACAK